MAPESPGLVKSAKQTHWSPLHFWVEAHRGEAQKLRLTQLFCGMEEYTWGTAVVSRVAASAQGMVLGSDGSLWLPSLSMGSRALLILMFAVYNPQTREVLFLASCYSSKFASTANLSLPLPTWPHCSVLAVPLPLVERPFCLCLPAWSSVPWVQSFWRMHRTLELCLPHWTCPGPCHEHPGWVQLCLPAVCLLSPFTCDPYSWILSLPNLNFIHSLTVFPADCITHMRKNNKVSGKCL